MKSSSLTKLVRVADRGGARGDPPGAAKLGHTPSGPDTARRALALLDATRVLDVVADPAHFFDL
jgi:hypothetical protein